MRKPVGLPLAMIVLLAVVMGAQGRESVLPESPDAALKAATTTELVTGDAQAAIEQYRGLANRYRSEAPSVAARALMQMAAAYEKLGRADAMDVYRQIVKEFPSEADTAAAARARLAALAPQVTSRELTLRALPRTNVLPGNVTPDGRYLAYASWDDGELYVRDLRTGTDRVLTRRRDGNIGVPAISRDGASVAYQVFERGCEGRDDGKAALCAVSVEGQGLPTPRTLVSGDEVLEVAPMEWSPDGRWIAVNLRRQDRTTQVALVGSADGSVRVLHTADWRGPTRTMFSRDGRLLVFDLPASETTDDRRIMMVAADGARGRIVVDHPSQNYPMGWTPDGSALLFASDRNSTMSLWSQPFANGAPQGVARLIRPNLGGAWSLGITNDGALYYAARKYDRDISVAPIDVSAGTFVGPPVRPIQRYVGTNSMPEWSPDGRHLAYISQRGLDPTNNSGRLVVVRDMTSGVEREVRPALLYFGGLSWSPDGRRLLTAGTDTKGRKGIFSIDAARGDVTLIADATLDAGLGSAPAWFPDGRQILYQKGRWSGASIVLRDLDSGTERVVVGARGRPSVFSVSPNGRWIVYPAAGKEGGPFTTLKLCDVQTGSVRDLFTGGGNEELTIAQQPQWTSDSRGVLVRLRTPNELWFVSLDGSAPRKMDIDVRDWSFGSVGQYRLDREGRRIAFLTGELSNELMVLENFLPTPGSTR